MRFEGNPDVLRNLFRRQKHIAQGDIRQYDYRPVVFASTGVRRGVWGGGKGRALERRKLQNVFTHVLGSSTGAAGGLFFLAGQVHKHIDLHWVEGGSEDFISLRRFLSGKGPIEDTAFLCEAFRHKLDLTSFNACPAQFWVGVTSAINGEGEFLDAKRQDMHPVDLVQPSISIPGLCGGPIYIDGHPYYDGAGAMGMPTRRIIEQFSPTDLLIFPNSPNEEKESVVERLLSELLLVRENADVRHTFRDRHRRFEEGIRYLREQTSCRWAIVWSDDSIGQYEKDVAALQSAADRAELFMEDLLVSAEAYVKQETEAIAAE